MANRSVKRWRGVLLAPILAVLVLSSACKDDGTDVSKFGPKQAELVGSWTSDDSDQPGTITFRGDGTYTRDRGPGAKPEAGPFKLKGSLLTWADQRQETIAMVDGVLYLDAFVRKPGKRESLSGTWSSHRGDAFGSQQEVWEISGEKVEFDVHQVRDGYEVNYQGHGTLEPDGERFYVHIEEETGPIYGDSDHDGRLALQQLGPDALHVAFAYPESGDTPAFPLDAWQKVQD